MNYAPDSLEARLLSEESRAIGEVTRLIAGALTAPRFWSLRAEWPDLHQEVMMRLVESLRAGRFDPTRDFSAYVRGVTRFTALREITLRMRSPETEGDPELRSGEAGNAEHRVVVLQMVRSVLDAATESCRDVIRAYYLDDLDYDEIAARQGVPTGTVKSRLFRCLSRCRRVLRCFSARSRRLGVER